MTLQPTSETYRTQLPSIQSISDLDVEDLLFAVDEPGEEFWEAAKKLSSEERTELLLDRIEPLKSPQDERVLKFITLGIDSNLRDGRGDNLLHRIFSWRISDRDLLAKILGEIASQSTDYRALWNTKNLYYGMTPLMCAVGEPLFLEICKHASNAQTDFFAQDSAGQNLLHHILFSTEAVNLLSIHPSDCALLNNFDVNFTCHDAQNSLWATIMDQMREASDDLRNREWLYRLLKVATLLGGKVKNLEDALSILRSYQEELRIEESRGFFLEVLVFNSTLTNREKNEVCSYSIELALHLPHGRAEASLERVLDLLERYREADFFSPHERLFFGEQGLIPFVRNLSEKKTALPKKDLWRKVEAFAEKMSPPEMLDFYRNLLRALLALHIEAEELEEYGFSKEEIDDEITYKGLFLWNFLPDLNREGEHIPPLFDAVKRGDLPAVKRFLDELPDGYMPVDLNGKTPLHWAVEAKNEEMIEVFIEKGVRYQSAYLMQVGMTHYHFAFFCGLPHLAEKLSEIDGEYCEKIEEVLERCLEEGLTASVIWLYQNQPHALPPFSFPLLKKLYRDGETREAITFLFLILQYDLSLVQDPHGEAVAFTLDHDYVETLQLLIDHGALKHLEFGIERKLLTRTNQPIIRTMIARAPVDFYENLFFYVNLSAFPNFYVFIMLEERLGFSEEEAMQYYALLSSRIQAMIENPDMMNFVMQSFLRTLFTLDIDMNTSDQLLDFLKKVMFTPFFALKSQEDKGRILHELYYHILTKFRPELVFKLEALLRCWRRVKSDHQMALFFNSLQSRTPLDQIEAALDDSASDSANIAYIAVTRFHSGKGILIQKYRNPPSPEIQLQALHALSKLAVPVSEDVRAKLLKTAKSPSSDLAIQSAETLWHSSKDPEDQELIEVILQLLNRPLEGELLKRLLALAGRLALHDDLGIFKILEISHSNDKEIRIQSALTLAQIREEKALLRAAEIVLSSDWEAWDPFYRHEERVYRGDGLRFVTPPRFHNSRSAMILRILDQLSLIKQFEIHDNLKRRYQLFLKEPKSFPHLMKLKATLKTLEAESLRYVPYPVTFPKGTLFRGLTDRKGKKLLQESIRALLRNGCQMADLTMFDGYFDFATWCKTGIVFTTYKLNYAARYSNEEDGVLIEIDSRYYNEELMRGRARLESESSLNSVFYEGVPLQYISKIYLSEVYRDDIEALHSDQPLEMIHWSSELFHRSSDGELKELRENLRNGVFEKIEFRKNLKGIKQDIQYREIVDRTLKRVIRRECIKEHYPKETFVLPDEILEDFNDKECFGVIDRLMDCFQAPGKALAEMKTLNTDAMTLETMKKSRLRKIRRLTALFRHDPAKLREKQSLHRLVDGDIVLIEALIEKKPYEDLMKKIGYSICTEEEYKVLAG